MLVGPFFFFNRKLIYNACQLSEAREQGGKLDNSYSHEKLFDDNFPYGDYIDYPRGRVIFDAQSNRAIIYIDPCINRPATIKKIVKAFEITDYVVSDDEHYHCKKCVGSIFI